MFGMHTDIRDKNIACALYDHRLSRGNLCSDKMFQKSNGASNDIYIVFQVWCERYIVEIMMMMMMMMMMMIHKHVVMFL